MKPNFNLEQNSEHGQWGTVLLVSVLVGLATCLVSESLIWAFVKLQSAQSFGKVAGEALFERSSGIVIVLSTLFWAPIFETLLGQLVPIELVRLKTRSMLASVVTSALVFAFGHALGGGGIGQTVLTFICGTPLAALYVHFRKFGVARSLASAMISHATSNGVVLILSFQILPLFDK
ncbi:CPBP family intramembrane glutamic endopeptidase [Undibacterium sp.]|uniref:CPBP family intramembrane glutamic endopeptidase n=1 Tax=Undibacterium sp. TaxID=1914977 RepID=UPI002C30D135|nr:CPBP family intramembrane glutamic endopeptidase [Undibacterium sp.]HTD05214.1 CPBP family intramembrane glutamic endopeptidase [Undibacterium sp.]